MNAYEQRHDRDFGAEIITEDETREQMLKRIKAHLARPITAREASGNPYETSKALRAHAALEDHPEHPYRRLIRAHREAKANT